MNTCRFADLTFDPQRLELRRQGQVLAMRPKTAALLRVLLVERGRIVAKRDLFERVWKTGHVQDQSLFQAISEIRKTLAPLNPIQTHPNLGYEWTLPVKPVQVPDKLRWAVAAAATIVVAVTATLATQRATQPATNGSRTPVATTAVIAPAAGAMAANGAAVAATQLPALQAFALGIQSLQSQRPADAEDFFAIAAQENPGFHEAALMVAESLLLQGRYDEAIARAEQVMRAAADDHYASVAAMDMLSKISQRSGRSQSALRWAENAAAEARAHALACAVDDTADRLAGLLETADQQKENLAAAEYPPQDLRHPATPAGEKDQSVVRTDDRSWDESPAYCAPLRDRRPAEPRAKTSHCGSAAAVSYAALAPARPRKTLV